MCVCLPQRECKEKSGRDCGVYLNVWGWGYEGRRDAQRKKETERRRERDEEKDGEKIHKEKREKWGEGKRLCASMKERKIVCVCVCVCVSDRKKDFE